MTKIILFDKFKNRKEDVLEDIPEELIRIQEDEDKLYSVKFIFQFYDVKKRAVYMEKSRMPVKDN